MAQQSQVAHTAQLQTTRPLAAPLYIGFAATGIGLALPGATLPAILARWHMSDSQGGRLFLFAWIGCSLGALVVHRSLRSPLFGGSLAIATGAIFLAFGSGSSLAANGSMLIYGAGLGLTMTSITLIRQACAGDRSATELIRLNLLWAIGAFLCPMLTSHALATGDFRPPLVALAALFGLLAIWCAVNCSLASFHAEPNAGAGWRALRRVPLSLICMIMLITGVEASAGGWLATYARRSGQGLASMVAAPTCLWAGLLLSRFFWSMPGRTVRRAQIIRGSALLTFVAGIALILRPEATVVEIAACVLGIGLGPLYPLLLDSVLCYTRGGPIFFLAGVGSACLPWLTGVVSTARGSLRTGLLVFVFGTAVVTLLALVSPAADWSSGSREPTRP